MTARRRLQLCRLAWQQGRLRAAHHGTHARHADRTAQGLRPLAGKHPGARPLPGTKDAAPHLSAAVLTNLLATPVEGLTVKQLYQIVDAIKRVPAGETPGITVGQLLT